MTVIEKSVDVDVPAQVAYNQWTQFEDFPRFMEGVERVEQIDDVRLHWHVNIGGVDREFDARIEEQKRDERIAWRATEGEEQAGAVRFETLAPDRTRIHLEMSYDADTWSEKVADFLNVVDRRVEGDLERFRDFIEGRGGETTGSWRGEVRGGDVDAGTTGDGSPATESGPTVPPPTGPAGEPEVGGAGHPGGPTAQPPRRS